ncbi:hypothetical protein HER14_01895 [Acidithiobacillus thiooxidans]|uniref:hypothetical protein n=1 Tax=Acidithiobacillus thiooxidans TaxID=930 RepID=UPI001C065648|nr:hypothetical protein [Acidithiobacillus thiooxidans]MBU2749755.1 hypothetical protein [Acidithiobacillus thiooxidans]
MASEQPVLKNPIETLTEIHPDTSDADAVPVTATPAISRRRRWLTVIGTAIVTLAFASDAFAYSGVGDMANNVSGVIQDGVNLLLGGTFITGLGFGAHSGLKAWEAHKQHGQGQARWSHVLTLAGVSAALIGLPALAYHYEGTIFHSNTGVQVQSVQMGGPYNNG